jgi:hypothetical protein
VIIAPLAIIGAIVFMSDGVSTRRRVKIDFLGALFVAVGMFLFVFALSEGGTYGWIKPVEAFTIGGVDLWPASRSVSIMPLVFLVALVILYGFYLVERSKERRDAAPLFEFAHLRLASYRYGLLTGLVLAMGQLGLSFVLPVFLQDGKHLTAARNGLWLLPTGLFVIVGAQVGGRLIRKVGTTVVVRMGLVLYAIGVALVLHSVNLNLTVWGLLPGLACYGAAHQRGALRDSQRELGRGQRRQHHSAPGRERARRRGDRLAAHGADRQPHDSRHQDRGNPHRGEAAGVGGRARARTELRAVGQHQPARHGTAHECARARRRDRYPLRALIRDRRRRGRRVPVVPHPARPRATG